jgi:hypothetical protein
LTAAAARQNDKNRQCGVWATFADHAAEPHSPASPAARFYIGPVSLSSDNLLRRSGALAAALVVEFFIRAVACRLGRGRRRLSHMADLAISNKVVRKNTDFLLLVAVPVLLNFLTDRPL